MEEETLVRPLLLCYPEKEIPAAPAMARPEVHFRSRATLEKGKKQIRAANAILNPHGIWADRTRGFKSQTPQGDGNVPEVVRVEVFKLFLGFKSQTPQGDGNEFEYYGFYVTAHPFQITNPARGRKLFL